MSENNNEKISRVGSRKSELALIQTKHVIGRLQKLYPEKKFEIHTMSTMGDRVLNVSLPKIGEKSLFTRDLEDALRNGSVDFVVHSLKDLPTALPIGMSIGAVLEREDSRDALVLNEKYKGKTIDSLPKGSVIGTSSLRRTAQLRRLYPHLEVSDIRGNLNTRLAKLDSPQSKFAGIILAQAGLLRMGWMNRISQVLEPTEILYAVGQGALAVECRSNDFQILEMLQNLMCLPTTCRILAERSFLKTLGGGCSAPVAVSTNLTNSEGNNNQNEFQLNIIGAVWSLDGVTEIRDNIESSLIMTKKILKNIENEDDNDVSPRKKTKPNETDDENINTKQNSPKIINDDKISSINIGAGDSINLPDLKHLIDVHGELFKKCPFYTKHQHDKKNGNDNAVQDECPLKIPVGQDFMGKCPYFNADQNVEVIEQLKGSCPITGKQIYETNTNNNTNKDETDKSMPSKCPFTATTSKLESTLDKVDQMQSENCPFLQKNQIKLIDCDEKKPIINVAPPKLVDDTAELFCGLYRHKCYKLDIFVNCEKLGKQLAENLIHRGALDVMKCAQDEIHDKI